MVLIEKQFYTSADVYMLGYGCGMSQYPQFYDKELDRYQVLPRPYRGSFEGFPGEKFVKMVVRLGRSTQHFCQGNPQNIP